MGVIQITITASSDQTIPGIPNTISLLTSEPATIFFTLDGCPPNTFSPIYAAPIQLPATRLEVVLNIFATNGIDSSAVITETYTGIQSEIITQVGDRVPHAAVACLDNSNGNIDLFPFGGSFETGPAKYLGTGNAGETIYNESLPATPDGYNGEGGGAGFTNKNINDYKFKQIYSTTNVEGEVFPGIGNLPANVKVIGKTTPVEYRPEISSTQDKIFNPRALVCYIDTQKEAQLTPDIIMRNDFSLENPEIVRDGALLGNVSLETDTTRGSFIARNYNPRTNEITASFRDASTNRWIFQKSQFTPTSKPNANYLAYMASPRAAPGANYVYQWHLFKSRILV